MASTQARSRRSETGAGPPAGRSFTLPPVGQALGVMSATALVAGGLFAYLLSQHRAGAGWLVFIAGAIALFLESHHLPGMRERTAWRRARREAGRLAKSVRRALVKQGPGLSSDVKARFDEALATVANAREFGDVQAIDTAAGKLDELADKHLVRKSAGREYVEQIGGAILIALFLRAFFYEPFKIPSGSMQPTLLVGDHLFVNKFVYGLRMPFTTVKLGMQTPERGDIVVFMRPGVQRGDDIIKRVVGLPGEVVEVRDRRITVDGVPVPTEPLGHVRLNRDGDSSEVTRDGVFTLFEAFRERIGDEQHVALSEVGMGPQPGTEGRWTVKDGHVFVMGDNRDNSADSRMGPEVDGFGQIPIEYIIGRADIIWFSKGGPYGVRFDRLFTLIH